MSKTYFVNNVDSFLGRSLLSKIKGPDGDEGDDPEPRVMCTKLDHEDSVKPRGVKKVLKVN
jgi:hypothetical protein